MSTKKYGTIIIKLLHLIYLKVLTQVLKLGNPFRTLLRQFKPFYEFLENNFKGYIMGEKTTKKARLPTADVLSGGTARALQLRSLGLDQQVQIRTLQSKRRA